MTGKAILYYLENQLGALKCLIAAKISNNEATFEKQITKDNTDLRFVIGSQTLSDVSSIALALSSDKFSFRKNPEKMSKLVQWVCFSKCDIIPFLHGLILQPGLTRDGRYQSKLRQGRLDESLKLLNDYLEKEKFLVGSDLSLADLELAIDLVPAFCSQPSLVPKENLHLTRWFNEVTQFPGFKSVLNISDVKFNGKGKKGNSKIGSTPVVENTPLKILCLHGYRQNEILFRDKLGAFRKIFGKSVDFKFVTAPHQVSPLDDPNAENQNQDQRGWWFSRDDDFFKASFVSDCDKGFSVSLDHILEACKTSGPFDGVLGFSQGASLAALLCSMQKRDITKDAEIKCFRLFVILIDQSPIQMKEILLIDRPSEKEPSFPTSFRFAILFAGFKSQSSKHAKWYDKGSRLRIPSLHVYGEDDKVIGDMSQDLVPYFESPSIVQHPGGHFIPASAKQRELYVEFINKFR